MSSALSSAPRVTGSRPAFVGDPCKGFSSPREFLKAVITAGIEKRVLDERLRYLMAAGSDEHSTQASPFGGFLVPEGFSPNLQAAAVESDPVSGRTTKIPMQQPTTRVPARTDKDHSSSTSGGLTLTRRVETQAGSDSRGTIGQVVLAADSLFGTTWATEELMVDSRLAFAAILERGFREEMQNHLLRERLRGTGAGEFSGIIDAACTIGVSRTGPGAIVGADVIAMREQIWRYQDAIWLACHDTYDNLVVAHIESDTPAGAVWLYQHATQGENEPDRLAGRPIWYTEFCSTLGLTGDLVLGTWSEYLDGTYMGPTMRESIHVRFINFERGLQFWTRNAGAPWWHAPLTPQNGLNTLSPFVTLIKGN